MWKRLLTLEPAFVRSVASVVVLIAANIGLNISDAADSAVTVVLAVLALLPLIQAWWTREAVTANGNVVERVDRASGYVIAGEAADVAPAGGAVRPYAASPEQH